MEDSLLLCSIISIAYGIFAIVLSLRIKERKDQLYLSLRSTNILQITNISISFSLIIVIFSFWSFNNLNKYFENLIYNLYLSFQIILFISILLKYHRLVICSAINYLEDDLENFKSFKIKDYYFQFFYIRILIIISAILLILAFVLSIYQINLRPLFYLIEEHNTSIQIIIWTIIFVVENSLLFVYALFILKKDLQAHLKSEILLLVILNVIYSLTIAFDLFNDIFPKEFLSNDKYEQIITVIYLILLQILTIFWPIWSCRVDNVSTTYNLTKEVAHDFYLCLSNEKSYNKFEKYLKEDTESTDENLQAIELYTRIMKYRLSYSLNRGYFFSSLKQDVREINEKFLLNKTCLEFQDKNIDETIPRFENIKSNILRALSDDNFEKDLFDKLLEIVYDYLIEKFYKFILSEYYDDLITEISYETYIRCKLTNCGLLKK